MPSIKYKKKTYAGATFPVLEMTKAEYDALPEAKKMDGTVYMITDDTGGWEAEDSAYDNTESGLTATNVQDALDEIVTDTIPNLVSKVRDVLWLRQAGGSATYSTGAYTIKVPALHLINVNLNNIIVVAQLNPGSSYTIGAINGIVLDGMSEMRVHVNRHNANHAAATLKLYNNTDNNQILLNIEPLETVPSGVAMATTVTFFYKDA